MYTDFHCHILPGIDDGSPDTDISVKMAEAEKKSGIGRIVATPHFYMSEQSVDSFLRRREYAYEQLSPLIGDIELICGAEVLYTHSLADADLKKLCIGDTGYMLIELPYQRLSSDFIRSFRSFANEISSDISLILAHAERYLSFTDEESVYEIIDAADMLVQLNCGSFRTFSKTSKFVMNMVKNGTAHLLGTDCHNITTRPPDMDTARKAILKKLSSAAFDRLMKNAEVIASGGRIGD